jgi:hypothetical protein
LKSKAALKSEADFEQNVYAIANRQQLAPWVLSFVGGALPVAMVTFITGETAWANMLYYLVAIPVMCVVVAALSYRFPQNPGRWTTFMSLGQCVAAAFVGGGWGIIPLAILFMMVLSLPQFLTAVWASRLAMRAALRAEAVQGDAGK